MSGLRGSSGFTLVEALWAGFLLLMLLSAALPLGRMIRSSQVGLLREQVLEQTSAYVLSALSGAFAQATCAEVPAAGAGKVLLLRLGRDCEGARISSPDRYALCCVDAGGRLLFSSGPWGDAFSEAGAPTAAGIQLLSCGAAYRGWARLSLPRVQAAGGFEVDPGARNRVRLGLSLSLPFSPRLIRLETAFAYQGGL